MQRAIGTLGILGTALGAGLAALAGGCVANGGDESIVVLKNVLPASGCVLTAMANETGISRGALDTKIIAGRGYLFSAQLTSRITAAPGMEVQRMISVRGANVDIAFPGSALFSDAELATLKSSGLTHFKSEFFAHLAPNGGLTDVVFELIPAALITMIAGKPGFTSVAAETSFTVLGQLAGGDVTSQTFHYPVTMVSGGLQYDNGDCSSLGADFKPRIGNPCNFGQDDTVDCCTVTDQTTQVTTNKCPAVGTKKM